jgi:hypothetical protein
MSSQVKKSYFESFVLALVLCLMPLKIFSYLIPCVVLGWFLYRTSSGKLLQRILIALSVFVVMVVFYHFLALWQGETFLIGNALLSFLTYSTFIFLLIVPGRLIDHATTYDNYVPILKWAILIEGTIGILQFVIVTLARLSPIINSDAVQGTIGIEAMFTGSAGFGNQIFVICMAFLLILYFPYVRAHRKDYYVFAIGVLSIMLAAVLHVFISLLWALFVTILFYRKNLLFSDFSKILVGALSIILLLLPLEVFFPGISKTTSVFFKIYQGQDSPKFEAMNNTVDRLPDRYPLVNLVGLGPGQYCSRAGLIASGRYYSTRMSFLPNRTSDIFRKYFQRSWRKYINSPKRYGNSTMHRPFFSLLSIFSEFGLVGLLLFLGGILYFFVKIRSFFLFFKNTHPLYGHVAFSMGILLMLLVFISTFENYLETPQALLPGMMLFKLLYNQLNAELTKQLTVKKAIA